MYSKAKSYKIKAPVRESVMAILFKFSLFRYTSKISFIISYCFEKIYFYSLKAQPKAVVGAVT